MLDKKVVTLYIDDTSIRVLEASGGRIVKWADLQLEPGLVKGGVVLQEEEMANRIRQLMKDQKIETRYVVLGLSGLHSITRPLTLPQLPRAMFQEAVMREARRMLPVSLDQLYIAWKTLPSPKNKVQVFIAATPKRTADSLIRTIRAAGLDTRHMALKPLVLTKTVKETTAIVVDVQPNEFDIVVMCEGVSQPIRTVALPAEVESWEQKLGMINNDLDRTIKFFDSNSPDKPLAADVPIYVSGELCSRPEMQKIMAETMGHPVKVLPPILKSAEPLDFGRYMTNIALSLKSVISGSDTGYSVSNLNVLPAPYQPKAMSLPSLMAVPGVAAAAVLVIPLVLIVQNSTVSIAALQNQLDSTNQAVNQMQVQKKNLTEAISSLEKQIAAAKQTDAAVKKALSTLNFQQETVNGDLQVAISVLPNSMSLGGINHAGDSLTLNGKASVESDVLSYAQGLDITGRFREVTIASLAIAKDGIDYSIITKRKQ